MDGDQKFTIAVELIEAGLDITDKLQKAYLEKENKTVSKVFSSILVGFKEGMVEDVRQRQRNGIIKVTDTGKTERIIEKPVLTGTVAMPDNKDKIDEEDRI